ncbi:hypothetical protein JCM19237_5845 [Photobacterium aphoticum]|uniref:Uncharacterized protein n=1 Tax=Photobacterium aphoticum TaxID=754436 RepID=A0A090R5Q5_9GAMM|nr:hypothetical protein JCM19237_5845 [Photobacterium aphoticum]
MNWTFDYSRIGLGIAIWLWLVYTAWGDMNAMLAVGASTAYYFYIVDRM